MTQLTYMRERPMREPAESVPELKDIDDIVLDLASRFGINPSKDPNYPQRDVVAELPEQEVVLNVHGVAHWTLHYAHLQRGSTTGAYWKETSLIRDETGLKVHKLPPGQTETTPVAGPIGRIRALGILENMRDRLEDEPSRRTDSEF